MTLLVAALALAAAAEPPLTEARAVEAALRADPRLAALSHGVDGRLALRDAAGRLENPELRVHNLRSDRLVQPAIDGARYPDHPLDDVRVGVRWEPPGLGERAERRALAEADAAKAAAELALHRRAVVARARGLHATVLGLDAQLAAARAAQEERGRIHGLVRRRAEQGAATAVDESAAGVDVVTAAARVEELEIRRRRAHADLLAELGLPPGAQVTLSADGAPRCAPSPEPPPQGVAARADDPWQRAIERDLAAADAGLSRRRLALVPWPSSVQLSYVIKGDLAPSYWVFQLDLTLPLLDWKRAERRALVAERARLEDERRVRAAAVDREVRRAAAEQAEQAALARRHLETAAVLEACLDRFRRGAEPIGVGVIQAGELRARQLDARRAQLEAELQCVLGQIELDRLAGSAGS